MTMPRALDLMEAWRIAPPLHWMVSAYLGVSREKPKKQEEADWEGLAAMMGTTLKRGKLDGQ